MLITKFKLLILCVFILLVCRALLMQKHIILVLVVELV